MAFDFLTNLDSTSFFLLLIVFMLFVMSMKKALSVMWNAVWIAGISVIFPIVMNKLFDFAIPTDMDSLLSFMLLGLGVYFVYLVGQAIYKMLQEVEKVTAKIPKPKINLPKGEHHENKEKYAEIREESTREKDLKKREEELKKKEEHLAWMSKLEQSKKVRSKNEDDYAVLEDKETGEKRPHSHVEPLPEIKHKKKRSKDED
jgi:hypothetical protein